MINRDKVVELRRQRTELQRKVDYLTVQIEAEERVVHAAYDALRQKLANKLLRD